MKFCLIGHKLGHSYSPYIHKEFGYSYQLCELEKEEIGNFIKHGGYAGFNVTIPYKTLVMPFLDVIDQAAQDVGAVNTVVNKNGKLYGYNTDVFGLDYLLHSADITLQDKKVVILGSGGTAKTALAVANMQSAREVVIVSRTGQDNYKNIHQHYDSEVIINTTPVGMYPNNLESPIDITPFNNLEGVADAIYNPFITKLLFDARERGVKYTSGLKMLIAQAKQARDLFLSSTAPVSEIDRIYNKLYHDTINIVLVGMPSAGKTVVGESLAATLNKTFKDTDKHIENLTGKSIPDIFASYGESHFRQLEREALFTLGKEKGLVIATGGGALTSEHAYRMLKQNGVIVYLVRDAKKVVSEGRPLLQYKTDYQRLLKIREPYFVKYSDLTIANDGEVEETVKQIIERLYEKNIGN